MFPSTPNRIFVYSVMTYTKKNVEPLCHSLHGLRPSHCPVSRNEQRWKPHADVQYITTFNDIDKTANAKEDYIKYIPWDVPVALFLTYSWSCEVQDRQNQSVQLRLLCICITTRLCPLRLSANQWRCKFSIFFVKGKGNLRKKMEINVF